VSLFKRIRKAKRQRLKTKKYLVRTTYRRKGWSDERIEREWRKGNIRIRAKDVGRKGHHYVRMYYYNKNNELVKVQFRKYKPGD